MTEQRKKLILNIDPHKLKWGQQKLLFRLMGKMSKFDEKYLAENGVEEMVETIETIILTYSNWTKEEIDDLEFSEIQTVFNTLKGAFNQNPPLEKSPN